MLGLRRLTRKSNISSFVRIKRNYTIQLHGKNIIGHKVMASENAKQIEVRSPLTREKLDSICFYNATDAELNAAVELAAQAARPFKNISSDKHVAFLRKIHEELLKRKSEIIRRTSQETGYPEERLGGNFARMLNQIKDFTLYVEEGNYVSAKIFRDPNKPDVGRINIPIGPVVILGATAFPLTQGSSGNDVIAALSARCPVISVSHVPHLGISELLATSIQSASKAVGIPEGVYSMIHGQEEELIKLVRNPHIRAIGFYGREELGKKLYHESMKRKIPIPIFGEMRSVNPSVILSGALEFNQVRIANELADVFTKRKGQYDTKPGLILTLGDPTNFLKELKPKVEVAEVDPFSNEEDKHAYTRTINAIVKLPGVDTVVHISDPQLGPGATVFSTDYSSFMKHHDILSKEIIGPCTIVVKCDDMNQITSILQSLGGQICASVHASFNDHDNVPHILDTLEDNVGRIVFNQFPVGFDLSNAIFNANPFPSYIDTRSGNIGRKTIKKWMRPICYQNFHMAQEFLPHQIRDIPDEPVTREENGVPTFRLGKSSL